MCHGRIAPKSNSAFIVPSVGHGVFLQLVFLSTLLGDGLASVCPLPPEPENGGYICHPRPCKDPLTAGSVIEYLCAEGYMLKGDYKYLTCKDGEWKPAMEVSCHLNEGVTKGFLGTKSPSWLMGSRLRYLHTKKLYMAVLVIACHRLTPEYRSFCRKGLHLVGGTCQGSSSCRARGPAPLWVERTRPRAILGCVKPGVPRAQRL